MLIPAWKIRSQVVVILSILTSVAVGAGQGAEYTGKLKADLAPGPSRSLIKAVAEAVVDVAGTPTLVQFAVDPETGAINPRDGWLGVDGNGDGRIDASFWSVEQAYPNDEQVVFQAGGHYVSVKSVDRRSGKIVLRDHPPSDYKRISAEVGSVIPDFEFVDFKGARRHLFEFRGKFVLLDFWGTWCGPCVAQMPHLKAAYSALHSRGFEIIGFDCEERGLTPADVEFERARKFVAENGVTWTQATPDSSTDIYRTRFRIRTFPTTLLLDPNGKVLSTHSLQMPLRGTALLATLEKVMASPR